MTTLVKRDLIGSSMFNTETSYGSRAERRVFVRLDPDDAFVNNTPIGKAIEKAIDGQYHHPDDETLPLKEAKAVQIGKDTFEVSLEYKRSKTSGGALDVPGGSAVVSNWRTRLVPYQSFLTPESYSSRYNGVPTGGLGTDIPDGTPADQLPSDHPRQEYEVFWRSFDGSPPGKSSDSKNTDPQIGPTATAIFIPESDITVPVVLDKYQFARLQTEVLPKVGHLNSNEITNFGGLGFSVGELMLVGIDNDWVNQRSLGAQGFVSELTFSVAYHFKFRHGGHVLEVPTHNGRPDPYARWQMFYASSGRYSVFENFPI